ncbi:MAG TPA: zf-HC2 domain-containing protein, partial [Pyrinomonadaceae bacterium]|nr:zf-HC2 domain-containing protein [Pyrinomonadaceae bacterium]
MKSETITFESGCERSAEILPYLYKEVSDAERDGFDAHLAECSGCRDEFAAISFSRYSVYEWQREEFAPLATPDLAAAFAPDAADSEPVGWLDGIREWFALPQRIAFAGGVAAIAGGVIVGGVYFTSPEPASTAGIVKE